jgi:hypothetical protein
MLGWIREKMATQESALGGGRFFAFSPTTVGTAPQPTMARALHAEELAGAHALQVEELAMARALQARIAQPLLGMAIGIIHIHLTHVIGVRSSCGKLSTLVQCTLHMGGSSKG